MKMEFISFSEMTPFFVIACLSVDSDLVSDNCKQSITVIFYY